MGLEDQLKRMKVTIDPTIQDLRCQNCIESYISTMNIGLPRIEIKNFIKRHFKCREVYINGELIKEK